MTEQALVMFRNDEGLGRLTLNRPDAANAVTPEFIDAFTAAIGEAEHSGCRVLLLDAAGKNFCVGADLKHFAARLDAIPPELERMANGFHAALARLYALPIPVVAAVRGNAVGAGFGLALAADIIIAADSARFSTAYARLGLSADAGVSYFLTRAIGVRLARSLLLTARFVSADEAKGYGLVDRSVPAGELATEAEKAARELLAGSPGAHAAIKTLTDQAWSAPDLPTQLDHERDAIVALAADPRVAQAMAGMLGRSG